jgi:membrane fusion protein, multidrug efflux system
MTRLTHLATILLAILSLAGVRTHADEVEGLVLPFKQVSVSSPPVQDIIKEVMVKEGDTVQEGQVLAQLVNDKEKLDVEQYATMVEKRQFDATAAETAFKEKFGSKEAMLQKQTDLKLAKIQHQMAQVNLNLKTIKAPLSGIVVKKYKESGESVDRVDKIVDVVNIDQVYVQFYIDPKVTLQLKLDQQVPVRFPVLVGSKSFVGTIAFIDPRIDASSGLCRIKVLIDNPDHQIRAGMRGHADFSPPKSVKG